MLMKSHIVFPGAVASILCIFFFFFHPPANRGKKKLTTLPRISIRVVCRFLTQLLCRSLQSSKVAL